MKMYDKPILEIETLFADSEIALLNSSLIISKGEDYIFDDEGNE